MELKIIVTGTAIEKLTTQQGKVSTKPLKFFVTVVFHMMGLQLEFLKYINTISKHSDCECLMPFNVIRYTTNLLIWNKGNKTALVAGSCFISSTQV